MYKKRSYFICATSLVLLLLGSNLISFVRAEDPKNQVAVVVQFGNGNYLTRIVEFSGETITGAEALQQSGLDVIVQSSSGIGVAVCKIEADGCDYPEEPCFCQCMGGSECLFWAYFVWRDTGWAFSNVGAAQKQLSDGEMNGWVWGGSSPLPELDTGQVFDSTRISVGYPKVASTDRRASVTAPYAGDIDADGTATISWRLVGASWSIPVSMAHQSGNYTAELDDLDPGFYEVKVCYDDPDGVNGSNCWTSSFTVGNPTSYTLFLPIHFSITEPSLHGRVQ